MATYILLLTLTPQGRESMLRDPQSVLRAGESTNIPGVQVLGLYGVLGEYDFVCILDAADNETAARFSIRLGVAAGLHVATLPAIPIARLEGAFFHEPLETEAGMTLTPPADREREKPREPGA